MLLAPFLSIIMISYSCQQRISENFDQILFKSSKITRALESITIIAQSEAKTAVHVITTEQSSNDVDFLQSLKILITIETIEELKEKKTKRDFNLILMNTSSELDALKLKFSPKLFNYQGHFLIIFLNIEFIEIGNLFNWFWEVQILNVNIMFEGGHNLINVYTFKPFDSSKCGETSPVLISTFENGKLNGSVEHFFPDKTLNLKHCPVRVATSNTSKPHVMQEHFRNGSFRLYGRDISLINSLSEALKFSINYTFVGEEGFISKNGTARGPFLQLLKDNADLILADFWLVTYRLKYFDSSAPYFTQQMAFVVPPGAELTSFEKFVLPLDGATWVLLVFCAIVGFSVIFIVRIKSTTLQDFVFGAGVKNPNLNLFVAIYGGSQHRLPKKNFARYLLMMFLMFCLVMRTLYTGSLYRFLKSKVYHKETQSIDEMVKRDYKIYYLETITDIIAGAQSQLQDRYDLKNQLRANLI